ncbi:hypothetical protein ZYGR_0A04610 [Zygosaccharomyces rouxii]|uniref:Uncharacterized protein n=1 Tax=Zygosaccharomyces rouxii TaxID=4956 RepID=A0A1Q2ZU86_ZYGRO|nr:hypothetical protein ZYGR_0A04610 [Zygosaccharomyces rouxii]
MLWGRLIRMAMSDSEVVGSMEAVPVPAPVTTGPATSTISVDGITGEVTVRKASGKVKVRKGQSKEEYENQLHDYFQLNGGPRKTEEKWMDEVDPLRLLQEKDLTIKLNRQSLSNFCERLYYQRRYDESLTLGEELLRRYQEVNKKNKMQREIEELEYMVKRSKGK